MKTIIALLVIEISVLISPVRSHVEDKNSGPQTSASMDNSIGEVIAYRELHLLEGVRTEDFEKFIRERLVPAFDQNVPGVTIKVMKGDRGEKKGVYVLLLIFDSINTRNYYFPTEQHGETNMPEKALSLWRPGQIPLVEEFDQYVEPLEENLFTDFNVLK